MNEKKNLFITFEGIDGSGKDTQLNKLIAQVREDDNFPFGDKYSNIWVTREPTKLTPQGEEICRRIREEDVPKEEATRLYVEDRIKHSRIIEQVLDHSHVFISRYDISTLSYQMTQGMDFDELYDLHKYGQKNGALIPDITLVFTLPESEANQRVSTRNGVRECFEKRDFQQELEKNTQYCIEELRKRGRVILEINADQAIENVTNEMFEKISSFLNK